MSYLYRHDRICLEMIYCDLYYFYIAHQKGLASDPVKYYAAPENQDLGIVKQQRKPTLPNSCLVSVRLNGLMLLD